MQARQFDLQLALVAAGTLREDLENEQGPVVDRHPEMSLEVALLCRAQGLIEEDFNSAMVLGQHLDFIGLAAAHEESGVGRLAAGDDAGDRLQPGGLSQQAQFLEFVIEMGETQVHTHQHHERGWVVG